MPPVDPVARQNGVASSVGRAFRSRRGAKHGHVAGLVDPRGRARRRRDPHPDRRTGNSGRSRADHLDRRGGRDPGADPARGLRRGLRGRRGAYPPRRTQAPAASLDPRLRPRGPCGQDRAGGPRDSRGKRTGPDRRRGLDCTHLRRRPRHPGRHGGRRAGDQRRHRPRLPQGTIMNALLVIGLVLVLFLVITILRSVRIVPQGRARNVERLGRYHRTLQPGMSFIVPFVDRVCPMMELREQVVSFEPRPVITEDNLVVEIDTVLYFLFFFQQTAAYEIANYLQAVEQLTVTTLRNVVGSMDLEQTLTSRDDINSRLRGVLDDATGRWGLRVNRVEIKAIDPPKSIKDAMEKQMRAERDKRATVLSAEGQRQSQILTAEGDKQGAILRAEGARSATVLKAEGEARAIDQVFSAVHRNDPDPKLLAYQYLQVLPQLAQGQGNTFWVIPSEITSALQDVSRAFTQALPRSPATAAQPSRPAPSRCRGHRRCDRRRRSPPAGRDPCGLG